MIVKAIILDIDGTLLNHQKLITERTKQALMNAQAKGINSYAVKRKIWR